MFLDDMVLMPGADYRAACNAIREKDGTNTLIKSGEMAERIRAIVTGGGLPDWIAECEIQTFTPAEDTQEAQTFNFSKLTKQPHIFVVSCDGVLGSYTQLDFLACEDVRLHGGSTINSRLSYIVYARGASIPWGGGMTNLITWDGNSVTVTPPTYGTMGKTYWRSKYTYTVMGLTLAFGGLSE